jgi:hypothetical protein
VLAFGEALAGTGKPLVAAASLGAPRNLGRPVTEYDVEIAAVGLAERGVRSSVVRLPLSNTARATVPASWGS